MMVFVLFVKKVAKSSAVRVDEGGGGGGQRRPIGTESKVAEDRGTVRRLLGLACLQRTVRALRVLVVIVQI